MIHPEVDAITDDGPHDGGMTFSDYLIDIALLSVVLRQLQGRRLDLWTFLLPLIIVGWVAHEYLHAVPIAGNDLYLVLVWVSVGTLIGSLAGGYTRLSPGPDGRIWAKAGAGAAGLWVLGIGLRLAFQLYASHGGGPAIARFSVHNDITSNTAWIAALLLMAIAEVVSRSTVLAIRARRWWVPSQRTFLAPASAASAPVGKHG